MMSKPSFLLFLLLSFTMMQKTVHSCGPNKTQQNLPKEGLEDDSDTAFSHETNNITDKEVKNIDDLSSNEIKIRLIFLLEKIDRNFNKNIEKKELYSWILRSLMSLNEEEVIERFKLTDKDTSGSVSWNEYTNSDNSMDSLTQHEYFLFNASDKDRDGNLNVIEFASFAHPEFDLEMHSYIIKRTLDENDSNKDGIISFKEFIGHRDVGHGKEWLDSEKKKFDNDLDKNADGNLRNEELITWIFPEQDDAVEEVNYLFSELDVDKNGVLSFEEVLNNVDEFLESMATDYGDHLINMHQFEEELFYMNRFEEEL